MNRCIPAVILLIISPLAFSQPIRSNAVVAGSVAIKSPPSITLYWEKDATATSYTIFRKSPDAVTWGVQLAALTGSDTTWKDNTPDLNTEYEYLLVKKNGNSGDKFGLVFSGIEVAPKEKRGILILVVDSAVSNNLPAEVNRLEWDLIGDGWQLEKLIVSPSDSVTQVKDRIKGVYLKDPANTKSVFLLGRVPVPYSGQLYPDGHPDHEGAWPADTYYGDMDGEWTDFDVHIQVASRKQNKNLSGDGKFDQSIVPGELELAVGRVDFYEMNVMGANYVPLIKRYLDKDHEYRHKIWEANYQAVVEDNFNFPEFFAGSGLRSFGSLLGPSSIVMDDPVSFLKSQGAILTYAAGAGWYTSGGGIGTSSTFNDSTIEGVFMMLFGSYFGDWDSEDNFLRAPLAGPGRTLVNIWAGRPSCHWHQMATGHTVGYSTLRSQNNPAASPYYPSGFMPQGVHTALMGDPTLRLHTLKGPSSIQFITGVKPDNKPKVTLSWTAAGESVDGYNVYLSRKRNGPYEKINTTLITSTSFENTEPVNGVNYYMVRAVKLESRSGATYHNLSQGVVDTLSFQIIGMEEINALENIQLYPNPASSAFYLSDLPDAAVEVSLLDLSGRDVDFILTRNGNTVKLVPEASLPAGAYILRIRSGELTCMKKIILIR